jgi:hypothetical protein
MRTLNCCVQILIVVLAAKFSPGSQAAVLGIYEFTGTSSGDNQLNAVTTQPANATFSTFTRVNVTWVSTADIFKSRAWSTASSQDTAEYVRFTVVANAGYALDLTALSFSFVRSGNGPANGLVSIFVDGATTPVGSLSFSPTASSQTLSWSSGTGFPTISSVSSVELRFYAWGAVDANGNLSFDNVSLDGQVVPEPTNVALSIFGIAVLTIAGRRWLKSPASV